jgi:hypothetical protein
MYACSDFESGVYCDFDSAEARVRQLHEIGYGDDEITVMMHDANRAAEFVKTGAGHAAQGAVTGGAIGGGLAALIAGVATAGGVAAMAGTGGAAAPLLVGPLALVLAGIGGAVGALLGAGIPREKAEEYEEALKRGAVLIGVHARAENRDEVRRILAG